MKSDNLGRRFRTTPTPHGVNLKITANDLNILLALQDHGFLPTNYLAKFHGSSLDYARDRMKLLFHERPKGYKRLVYRPLAQENTKYHLSNFASYALTKDGVKWLKDNGYYKETIRPDGGFPHQLMTSTVTASIELTARKLGIKYIPGHEILERAKAQRTWKNGKFKLIPDQLFALRYPDESYEAFVVEADRGTEQISHSPKRKTYEGNYQHYKEYIGKENFRDHLGLNCDLKVLNVMSNATRLHSYMNLMNRCHYMLFQHVEGFGPSFRVPGIMEQILKGEWLRKDHPTYNISE